MAMGAQSEGGNVSDGPNQMRHPPIMPIDCNLNLLCQHIQMEGFQSGSFSDVTVQAMGTTYNLHRLILSRSSYFRNMLHGPWKEAESPVLVLQIDDKNVSTEAIAMALAYLYGIYPKLNDENAFRILAVASFLDLQDLCSMCTDFIISELWTSNFLAYQIFAESQDYGIHGERVRAACWGYLCQSGAMELKEVLPKLSDQTLHALLTSDELWVPNEEKRFQLALYAFLAKGSSSSTEIPIHESAISDLGTCHPREQSQQVLPQDSNGNSCYEDQFSSSNSSLLEMNEPKSPLTYGENPSSSGSNRIEATGTTLKNDIPHSWFPNDQCKQCTSMDSTPEKALSNDWGRCGVSPLSWGGRVVGRRQAKAFGKGDYANDRDEFDTFFSIFEGGSLLYCSMPFEALLNARKQLEELGFPAKSVNDGLWLQMLLTHRVHEIGADTCKLCCATSLECTCRQSYEFLQGTDYYVQENERYNSQGSNGNAFSADPSRSVRVHVRCQVDGLAGIGRGTSSVPAAAWPPTRFVFSRVPFGMGSRNCQQTVGNDDSENRTDHNDAAGDGLTALAGLSSQNSSAIVSREQVDGAYETDPQSSLSGSSFAGPSSDSTVGVDWDAAHSSLIPLDVKTPLSQFPPFRFGVEFADVHRLGDGQVKHSVEVFYAGSLWKVSVQAFNDEEPQGRRTLGLFLHRRKAELADSLKNVNMYVDCREKVKARYQLICPSKREVMVFGSFKQRGTLLPKAPKGWGWRTALLFEELPDVLQNGTLRIAAVLQLV